MWSYSVRSRTHRTCKACVLMTLYFESNHMKYERFGCFIALTSGMDRINNIAACCSSYLRQDIIRRILEKFHNVSVVMVMGITDIDDKIIRRANEVLMLKTILCVLMSSCNVTWRMQLYDFFLLVCSVFCISSQYIKDKNALIASIEN